MSFVLITPETQRQIDALIAEARANFAPWAMLQDQALIDHDKPLVTLAERKGERRPTSRGIMLGDHKVAFSFEEQPAGICRHLSISVPTKGRVPHVAAVEMIALAFGFHWSPTSEGRKDSGRQGLVWLEEFEPGHHAVNLVEVDEPAAKGTLQ